MNDVLYTVMLLSIDESPADVRPGAEEAHESSLAVVDTGQDLTGLSVNQRDDGAGVGHTARDFHLVVTRQHVVIKKRNGWDERCIWICKFKEIHSRYTFRCKMAKRF